MLMKADDEVIFLHDGLVLVLILLVVVFFNKIHMAELAEGGKKLIG
jgi:hypothetical protein